MSTWLTGASDGIVRTRIEVYKKLRGEYVAQFEWETSPSTIIDAFVHIDVDQSIEPTADTFNVRMVNAKDDEGNYTYNSDKFRVDDRILIYATSKKSITSANKTECQLFDGSIIEISNTISDSGKVVMLKGQNRLSRMLNFTAPASYYKIVGSTGYSSTASDIVQTLIDEVNEGNPNFNIEWDSSYNSTTSTPIGYYRLYRPVIEMISELSLAKENQEFNAVFWLTPNNKFRWVDKTGLTPEIKLKEGVHFTKIKLQEKVWEVVNAMILNAGKDPSGNNTHCMYYDEQSAAEHGLKWHNQIEIKDFASQFYLELCRDPALGWIDNDDENKQNYPDSDSYDGDGLLMPFNDREDDGSEITGDYYVTSDTEFKLAIRKESKWLGIEYIKSQLDLTAHLRPKLDVEMKGPTWEAGESRTGSGEDCLDNDDDPLAPGDKTFVWINSKGGDWDIGEDGVLMRCVAVNHEINKNGWITTARLELDEEDASNYSGRGW